MTATATFGDHGAAEVLSNKKQMGQVLVARDSARSRMDWVRSLPSKARTGAMRVLEALKLDSAASWVGETFSGVLGALRARARQGLGLFARAIGWTNLVGWLLAHQPSRDKALSFVIKADTKVRSAGAKTRSLLARTPLAGATISKGIGLAARPFTAARGFVIRTANKGLDWLDAHDSTGAASWLRSAVKMSVLARTTRAFCPPQFRMFAYAGGMAVAFGPNVVEAAKQAQAEDTETAAATPEQAETARQADLDAQIDQGLAKAQNLGEVYEVQVVATGDTILLKVQPASDSADIKVVLYEGAEYDIKTLGEAETDPIKPTIDQMARNAKAAAQAVSKARPALNRADKRAAAAEHGPRHK